MADNFTFTTSDALTDEGLTTATFGELLDILQTGIQQIYSPTGEPIDFSSSSPDGQLTNILATMGAIVRELITMVYNSTDPSKCEGVQQDSKYQLNFLYRKGGSYTIQNINISANKTVSLQGLDGSYSSNSSSAFTVSDDNGNLWYLIDSTTVQPGTTSLPFRAQNIGEIVPVIGTITNILTVTDGIKSVINDVGVTSTGTVQESNEAFRLRREKSAAKQSGNTFDTIIAQILELEGVIDATGENNNTAEESSQHTPAHTIWIIVNGGSNEAIADIIYSNMAGTGTRGSVTVEINSISAQTFDIKFDRPIIVPFFIKFDLQPLFDELTVNKQSIQDYISENLTFLLGENLSTVKPTETAAAALENLGNIGYPVNVQISLGGTAEGSYTPGSESVLTNIQVNNTLFQQAVGDVESQAFIFKYYDNTTQWELDGVRVNMETYGISYEGTPSNNDTITVNFEQGTWTNYIPSASLQNMFVITSNNIFINVIGQD